MRSIRFLILGLVLLCFLELAVAGPYHFNARQDEGPSSEALQTSATSQDESPRETSFATETEKSSEEPTESAVQTERPSETSDPTSIRSAISVTASLSTAPTKTAGLDGASPSHSAEAASANALPIHPRITPAMGLAGAFLLISGLVYTVIGIKKQWLYVSFSAAYLTSLAVTVLIVYLMSPPVSDAVQGGFFVAAVLTGLLFGGLSLVFADLTDGLGCLLGGFCLSMWFLTLKEGGLIASTTGRAIFIGCMTAAGYCLSFSHYTRTYALIGCISFAGATVTMLGVDCFTCAGLKEFWLYLWHLSPDAFPLNTTTYPLTKAIKAEIAGIVILAVFGVISQIRLWRIVRAQRERKATAREERNQDLKREEEEVGRRLNHNLERERARWEAVYGDTQQQQDSVNDSSNEGSAKASMSFREKEVASSDSVEMVAWPPGERALKGHRMSSASKHASMGPSVVVTALPEEDEIQQIDQSGRPIASRTSHSAEKKDPSDTAANSVRLSSEHTSSGETRNSLSSSVSPPPVVVPLPFQIPKEEDNVSQEADNASVSVAVESVAESAHKRFSSKRLSGASLLKRLSVARSESEEEPLVVPHIDDRASSVAATVDEDVNGLSLPPSPLGSSFGETTAEDRTEDANPNGTGGSTAGEADSVGLVASSPHETDGKKSNDAASPPSSSGAISSDATRSNAGDDDASGANSDRPIDVPQIKSTNTSIGRSLTASTDPPPESPLNSQGDKHAIITGVKEVYDDKKTTETKDQTTRLRLSKEVLPDPLPKVALSYRTNEWAKHLDVAEEPEVEALSRPGSPGIKLAQHPEEKAAPLAEGVQGAQPAITVTSPKRTSTGRPPYPASSQMRSTTDISRVVLQDELGASQRDLTARPGATRRISNPYFAQSLDVAAAARLSKSPSPLTSKTLLGQRESLTRKNITPQNLTPSSSPNLLSTLEQENMTLAQRKQFIQQQKSPSASKQWRQSSLALGQQIQEFDSHQPRRASAGVDPNKREVMLAGWRESMRQDNNLNQPTTTVDMEAMRQAALNEKRQKDIARQERALKAQKRESAMDSMMRSGQMLDAHREAMRRMQAKANRTVTRNV